MGTITLWDRVKGGLSHPLSTLAAIIAFRFCENHDLEIWPRSKRPNRV